MLHDLLIWWRRWRTRQRTRAQVRQRKGLIDLIRDSQHHSDDREEAAEYLGLLYSNDNEVEQALLSVASDLTTPPDVAYKCGKALAKMWSKSNIHPHLSILKQLTPDAIEGVAAVLEGSNSQWNTLLQKVSPRIDRP